MLRQRNISATLLLTFFSYAPLAAQERSDHEFTTEERAWWAIQSVRDPVVPEYTDSEHPIDAFVARKRRASGLSSAPSASTEEFIRRATFDLHGLPPSPADIESFREAWDKDADTAMANAGRNTGLMSSATPRATVTVKMPSGPKHIATATT
jgi:hypothetical protein